MVSHAIVYLNKFSLIITILGYILAIVSAVVYGLYSPTCELIYGNQPDKTVQNSNKSSKSQSYIKNIVHNPKNFDLLLYHNDTPIWWLIESKKSSLEKYTIDDELAILSTQWTKKQKLQIPSEEEGYKEKEISIYSEP